MVIKGTVHCFFEQSGTFKNEFKKKGINAYDYDISNHYGQTDYVVDLFAAIDDAYEGRSSLFDQIDRDNDLILAFYPCTYFCAPSQMAFYLSYVNYNRLSVADKIARIIERSAKRETHYTRLIKFCAICLLRDIRMILENPWSEQTYLKGNFIAVPTLVDMDRSRRGDYFKKPTAYWFFNSQPTAGYTYQRNKAVKQIMATCGTSKGTRAEQRSFISPDYARTFINDFILGETSTQATLFKEDIL